jgi:hypothetical protein
MEELVSNIHAIIRSISPMEVITKLFFMFVRLVLLLVFVTLLVILVVNYQLFLIITTIASSVVNFYYQLPIPF